MSAIKTLAIATVLCVAAASAKAATYNVVNIQYQKIVCGSVSASSWASAFKICMERGGLATPLWAVVVTTAPTCRSTNRVQNLQGLGSRWVYDRRFFVPTPECP